MERHFLQLPCCPNGDLDDYIFAEIDYHISER